MRAVKGEITKRMDEVVGELQSEFKSLYTREEVMSKLQAVKKAENRSDGPSKLKNLYDVFDRCKIEYEKGRDSGYYENLINKANFPTFEEITGKVMKVLYDRFKEYPSPENYMKRIVDRLCCDEDGWQNDTLRIRILKQFIKYGNYLEDAGIKGKTTIMEYVENKIGRRPTIEEVLSNVDDDIFSFLIIKNKNVNYDGMSKEEIRRLKQQEKDKRKTLKKKVELLRISDDLATGKFRVEGTTKKSLYLFAIVYGMTYCLKDIDESTEIDYETDIEKNLFRDYYTNNLIRFISDAYKGKLREYERDPSGQGINYKNFAEMVYLYYISKNSYKPQEKIKLSNKMIKDIQKMEKLQKGNELIGVRETKEYRDYFKNSAEKLSLSEEEFKEFICDHYNCDRHMGKRIVGVFQLENEQNTAFKEYQSIIKDLTDLGVALENCNYGLWFTDISAFRKKVDKDIGNWRVDNDRFKEFIELLFCMNSFMGYTFDEKTSSQNKNQEWRKPSRMKTRALYIPSASAVTRTSMIVAYYYYYNALNENDRNCWNSFEEVFEDFKEGIDKKLKEAHYQPLSEKNIFDILIVFSSYTYLNI